MRSRVVKAAEADVKKSRGPRIKILLMHLLLDVAGVMNRHEQVSVESQATQVKGLTKQYSDQWSKK